MPPGNAGSHVWSRVEDVGDVAWAKSDLNEERIDFVCVLADLPALLALLLVGTGGDGGRVVANEEVDDFEETVEREEEVSEHVIELLPSCSIVNTPILTASPCEPSRP